MTRPILDDENEAISVNTFWGGKEKGECCQITLKAKSEYGYAHIHLTRDETIELLEKALTRLKKQVIADKKNPPFWQAISSKKH